MVSGHANRANRPNTWLRRPKPASDESPCQLGAIHCTGISSDLHRFAIATLVERHTRYVMLAKVAGKDTRTVVAALIKQAKKLPKELYKSLTWDRPDDRLRAAIQNQTRSFRGDANGSAQSAAR
jgi:IS30 family transposase